MLAVIQVCVAEKPLICHVRSVSTRLCCWLQCFNDPIFCFAFPAGSTWGGFKVRGCSHIRFSCCSDFFVNESPNYFRHQAHFLFPDMGPPVGFNYLGKCCRHGQTTYMWHPLSARVELASFVHWSGNAAIAASAAAENPSNFRRIQY